MKAWFHGTESNVACRERTLDKKMRLKGGKEKEAWGNETSAEPRRQSTKKKEKPEWRSKRSLGTLKKIRRVGELRSERIDVLY